MSKATSRLQDNAGESTAIIRRGQVVATVVDQYGDERLLMKKGRGQGITVSRMGVTVPHVLNRVVAPVVGAKIRQLREKKGMGRTELALRAGLSSVIPKHRVYEIEKALRRHGVRLGTLYAIAAVLGCEVAALLPPVADVLNDGNVRWTKDEVPVLATDGTESDVVTMARSTLRNELD